MKVVLYARHEGILNGHIYRIIDKMVSRADDVGVHASQHGLSIPVMSALISARRVEDKNTDCSNLDTALWSVCVAKRELRNRKTAYVLERRELDAQSVPEGVQRGLARTIHATEWKRANTSDTADVQDTCAGRGEQEGQERLDHRDHAEEVRRRAPLHA